MLESLESYCNESLDIDIQNKIIETVKNMTVYLFELFFSINNILPNSKSLQELANLPLDDQIVSYLDALEKLSTEYN